MNNHQFQLVRTDDYLGLSEPQATAIAEDAGYRVRVTAREGNHFAVTRDLREDRMNFELSAHQVVRAYIG